MGICQHQCHGQLSKFCSVGKKLRGDPVFQRDLSMSLWWWGGGRRDNSLFLYGVRVVIDILYRLPGILPHLGEKIHAALF